MVECPDEDVRRLNKKYPKGNNRSPESQEAQSLDRRKLFGLFCIIWAWQPSSARDLDSIHTNFVPVSYRYGFDGQTVSEIFEYCDNIQAYCLGKVADEPLGSILFLRIQSFAHFQHEFSFKCHFNNFYHSC